MPRESKPVVVLEDGRRVDVEVGRKLHGYLVGIARFDAEGRRAGFASAFEAGLVEAIQTALLTYNQPDSVHWKSLEWI